MVHSKSNKRDQAINILGVNMDNLYSLGLQKNKTIFKKSTLNGLKWLWKLFNWTENGNKIDERDHL